MSKTTVVQIQWTTTGDDADGATHETTYTTTDSAEQLVLAPLTAGRNQIFLPGPPTFTCVLIIPPASSTVPKTYDAASTVGGALRPGAPVFIPVPDGTTSIYVNATGGAGTLEVLKVYVF